jgi:predicted phage terminase large subunit-like protein
VAEDQDIPLLDKTIEGLPTDIRQDLAERGKNDLFFFVKAILQYRDLTRSCHLPLCEFLDHNPSRFKMVLMPRGHFKTTVCTIGRVMQMALQDTNRRILVLNETSGNAEDFLSAMQQHFETNRVLRALYSKHIPKDFKKVAWNSKELELVRDVKEGVKTIEAMGMTGALTSHHYTHLQIDDPISEEAAKSDAVMHDAISRIDKVFSLMVKPELDTVNIVGTRWGLHDVYSYFLRKLGHRFKVFARAAVKDGVPIFPELISLETLGDIRSTIGEYAYSCLYMNNPRDIATQNFNVDDLRFWRWSTDEESIVLYDREGKISDEVYLHKLDVNVSVDLAISEKITNDMNAVVTTGQTPDGKIIILDAWGKRCTPLEVIEKLFEVKRRFNPRQFGIEAVAYQKALSYFVRAEATQRGEWLNIVPLKAIPSKRGTSNNSKEARIRGLQPLVAVGRVYILPTMHLLRDQLADFPLNKHDDVIDALAHQLVMWRGVINVKRMEKYAESEAKLLRYLRAGWGGEPLQAEGLDLDDEELGLSQFGPQQEFSVR